MNISITCARRLKFDYGHRIKDHKHIDNIGNETSLQGKCGSLHGHQGIILVEAQAINGLDSKGRVIDFGVLKGKIGKWIDDNWDHGWIAGEDDHAVIDAVNRLGSKLFILPYSPTAENMARYILEVVGPAELSEVGIVITKVTFWETENCFAEASLLT